MCKHDNFSVKVLQFASMHCFRQLIVMGTTALFREPNVFAWLPDIIICNITLFVQRPLDPFWDLGYTSDI